MKPLGPTLLQKQISRRVYKSCETSCFNLTRNELTLVLKVGRSPFKKDCYLLDWKPLKNNEKCFLFYFKSSFRSQDVYVFVTTFWSCRKNGLIRKVRFNSKFKTSQPGLQIIAIPILPNISQSKGNQTMKLSQLIEYNKREIFLQKLCGKYARRLVPDLFLFSKKA